MPGRTFREDSLADDLAVTLRRVRDPQSGLLVWRMEVVGATVDDATGEGVKQIRRDDLLDLLTAPQRTNVVALANTIRDRLATALSVAAEKP